MAVSDDVEVVVLLVAVDSLDHGLNSRHDVIGVIVLVSSVDNRTKLAAGHTLDSAEVAADHTLDSAMVAAVVVRTRYSAVVVFDAADNHHRLVFRCKWRSLYKLVDGLAESHRNDPDRGLVLVDGIRIDHIRKDVHRSSWTEEVGEVHTNDLAVTHILVADDIYRRPYRGTVVCDMNWAVKCSPSHDSVAVHRSTA